jgi:hypothetical protein
MVNRDTSEFPPQRNLYSLSLTATPEQVAGFVIDTIIGNSRTLNVRMNAMGNFTAVTALGHTDL